MTTSRRFRAILALIFINAMWGLSFPLMRMINDLMERAVPPGPGARSTIAVVVDHLTRAPLHGPAVRDRHGGAGAGVAVAVPRACREASG